MENTKYFDDYYSNERYHELGAIGSSGLKKINQSINHFESSKRRPTKATKDMIFGSAFHSLLLEPLKFNSEYAILEKFDCRTKLGKTQKALFEDLHKGKTIIDESELARLYEMVGAVRNHSIAEGLLTNGVAERSFFWDDSETEISCKCRPDYLRDDNIIVDVKTTRDASYDSFLKDVVLYQYFLQAAFYSEGVGGVTGKPVEAFIFLCVEKEEPFNVALYTLDEMALELGEDAFRHALGKYKRYTDSPQTTQTGYPVEIKEMSLPSWAHTKYNYSN